MTGLDHSFINWNNLALITAHVTSNDLIKSYMVYFTSWSLRLRFWMCPLHRIPFTIVLASHDLSNMSSYRHLPYDLSNPMIWNYDLEL